jgi:hypothetical protein
LLSSFPAAFGFFFSYELSKKIQTESRIILLHELLEFEKKEGPYIHLIAAACGETTAALIRLDNYHSI